MDEPVNRPNGRKEPRGSGDRCPGTNIGRKECYVIGIILTATGFIALATGLLRGKGNVNLSRKATLIAGSVLLVVGVVFLAVALV